MPAERAIALPAERQPMLLRFLAWLLGLANARAASSVYRRELYDLKDRILRRFAVRDGEDVQRIVHGCYGCDGTGAVSGDGCRRCGGSGVWDTRWILLERWRLAGRVFHRPVGPTRPRAVDFVDGRIRHDDVHPRVAAEAALWLALLFDRRLFWRLLSRSRFSVWPWRPMLALQVVVFEARMRVARLRTYIAPRRCLHCPRRFYLGRAQHSACRACRTGWPTTEADDALPF